jgi:membrane fusion protein (multidrug efflux system)
MKKFLLYGVITIAIVALIIWKLQTNKKESAARTAQVKESTSGAVPVRTTKAGYTTFDQDFSANGNFQAESQVDFSSEISGRITHLYVDNGSVVSPGMVLARVDNDIVSADLQTARNNLNQTKTDFDRYTKALQTGGVTQKQVDDARLQYENARARYAQVSKNVSNTTIKSPIHGIINSNSVNVGTYLSAGTKMFQIVDISKLKLVVNVPESQVVQLKQGDRVNVTANVFPEVTYNGRITFIAAAGDATLNYPVEVEVNNVKGKQLKAGMYGTANFSLPKQAPALLIPRAAFYAGLNANVVYVYENGAAKNRQVVPGRVFGDKVEVRSGLKEGENVIISGQVNLTDGTAVTQQL